MQDGERPVLQSERASDFLIERGIAFALDKFVARSRAQKGLSLDPEMVVEEILARLAGYELLSRATSDHNESLTLRKDGHVLIAHVRRGYAMLEVLSGAPDAGCILKSLLDKFEPFKFKNKEEDGVWADFSHMSGGEVCLTTQFLRCPTWEEVRRNYPSKVRDSLDRIFAIRNPWKRGRLIIWHGPPGTGKTYAIRALMMHWKERFDFLVVNDPENLAKNPGYSYEVAGTSRDLPH